MIDLGTGNNNKINWAMNNKQEFIDIVEVVYRGARKGRGLVVSPKGNVGLQCVLLCGLQLAAVHYVMTINSCQMLKLSCRLFH